MKRHIVMILVIVCALIAGRFVLAEDEEPALRYFQSSRFNVPLLAGWEDQSSEDFAQFHFAETRATIRTALVSIDDPVAAAESDLRESLGREVGQPIYQDKVNLADGTWTVLIYQPEPQITASVMARNVQSETVVISFVESDPVGRILMATIAQSGETGPDAKSEIDLAAGKLTFPRARFEEHTTISLPSGDWAQYSGGRYTAMGLVFGNDSYVAIAELARDALPALADAFNRTLLGFFITPDNSLYLALALAVVFVILGTLAGSLFWRSRSLRKDLALLEELARDEA